MGGEKGEGHYPRSPPCFVRTPADHAVPHTHGHMYNHAYLTAP